MKKPRNKAYRPKYVPAIPIMFALPQAKKNDLMIEPHLCIEALRTGHGRQEHAWTLANCLTIGAALSKGQSDAAKKVMACGMEAIRLVLERGKSGKWGFSGTEMLAVMNGVTLADDLQQISTRRQVRDAIGYAWREAA